MLCILLKTIIKNVSLILSREYTLPPYTSSDGIEDRISEIEILSIDFRWKVIANLFDKIKDCG